jgi:uncharacterized integral membrane protein
MSRIAKGDSETDKQWLWYLNIYDILSWTMLGTLFLALHAALKRASPSLMSMGTYVALLGAVLLGAAGALSLAIVPLAERYAAATTEAQRMLYVTAWETPLTLGLLSMAIGGAMMSVVVLVARREERRGRDNGRRTSDGKGMGGLNAFGPVVGYLGIIGGIAAVAGFLVWISAPSLLAVLRPINHPYISAKDIAAQKQAAAWRTTA